MKNYRSLCLSIALMLSSLGLVAQEAIDDPGQAYFNQGHFEKAAKYWEEARSSIPENEPKYIDTSVRLAAAYQSLGHVNRALRVLEGALPLAENDPERKASVLLQLSGVYFAMRDFQERDMDCSMKEEIRPYSLTRQEIMNEAWYYLEHAKRAISYKKNRYPLLWANILNAKGNIEMARSEIFMYQEEDTKANESLGNAKSAYQESALLSKTDKILNTKSILNRLDTLRALRIFETEEKPLNPNDEYTLALQKAWQQVQKLPDKLHEKVFFLIKIANLAKLTPPLSFFTPVKKKTKEKAQSQRIKEINQIRSSALKEADKLAKRGQDKRAMSYATSHLALLRADEHDYSEAVHLTKSALDYLQYPISISNLQGEIIIRDGGDSFISGRFRNQGKQFVSTRFKIYLPSLLDECREKCQKLCQCQDISFSKNEWSNLSLEEKKAKEKQCKGSWKEGYWKDGYVVLSKDNKRYFSKECKGNCQFLPSLASQNYHPELLLHLERQLGMLLEKTGQRQDAIKAYERALEHLRVRQESHTVSQSFLKMAKKVPFELADLQLRQTANMEEGDNKRFLLKKIIDNIELFNAIEVENYFGDACVTKFKAKHKIDDVDDFFSLYPQNENTAVLYPLLFDDRAELLFFTQSGIEQVTSYKEKKFFEDQINDFNNGISKTNSILDAMRNKKAYVSLREDEKKTTNNLLDTSQAIYTSLFVNNIIDRLENQKIETLVVVPHGDLRTIPFAALYDSKEYLFQKFVLATVPGIKLVNYVEPNKNIVAFLGGADFHYIDPQEYPKVLPCVPLELKNISCILTGKKREWLGEDFVCPILESDSEKKWAEAEACKSAYQVSILKNKEFVLPSIINTFNENYTVVHFSTHGQFNPEPSKNYVRDGKYEKIMMEQLSEVFHSFKTFNFSVDLLTLSACEIAKVNKNAAALGFTSAALKIGVRSVLAAQWVVREDATTYLMSHFYNSLKENSEWSKAKALQEAQKLTLKKMEDCDIEGYCKIEEPDGSLTDRPPRQEFRSPYYWAPFSIVGNWF